VESCFGRFVLRDFLAVLQGLKIIEEGSISLCSKTLPGGVGGIVPSGQTVLENDPLVYQVLYCKKWGNHEEYVGENAPAFLFPAPQ
jgi:hypothetical protein